MRQIASGRSRWLAVLVLAAAMLSAPATASARSERTLAYPRAQVWPTAVRFLVVDEHLKILEKDADAGFVTFELREDGKTFRGALEVVTIVREGRTLVRFILQIEDRPSWIELGMLKRLEAKLRAELGAPAPEPSPAPPAEPPADAPKKAPPKPDSEAPKQDDHGPPISPTP